MKSTNGESFHYAVFTILLVSLSDSYYPVLHVLPRYNKVIRIPVQCVILTMLVLNTTWLINTFSQMRKAVNNYKEW